MPRPPSPSSSASSSPSLGPAPPTRSSRLHRRRLRTAAGPLRRLVRTGSTSCRSRRPAGRGRSRILPRAAHCGVTGPGSGVGRNRALRAACEPSGGAERELSVEAPGGRRGVAAGTRRAEWSGGRGSAVGGGQRSGAREDAAAEGAAAKGAAERAAVEGAAAGGSTSSPATLAGRVARWRAMLATPLASTASHRDRTRPQPRRSPARGARHRRSSRSADGSGARGRRAAAWGGAAARGAAWGRRGERRRRRRGRRADQPRTRPFARMSASWSSIQ